MLSVTNNSQASAQLRAVLLANRSTRWQKSEGGTHVNYLSERQTLEAERP